MPLDKDFLEDTLLYLSAKYREKEQYFLVELLREQGEKSQLVAAYMDYFRMDENNIRWEAEKIRAEIVEWGLSYITFLSPIYPELLKQIRQAPSVIFYKGNISCLSKPSLSVVGTRKPSFDGIRAVDGLIRNLSAYAGYMSIVSGLALGVDSLVHKASIKYGLSAISVLPSSLDNLTPRSNRYLAEQILAHGGLIISEKYLKHEIRTHSYIERNRIISGLSRKTVIIEAALRSGSMSTARLALEQNRDVYAMPGSLSNPVAEGCNYLISCGAYPLCRFDVFSEDEEFKSLVSSPDKNGMEFRLPSNFRDDGLLKSILSAKRVTMDDIALSCKLTSSELYAKLLEYEMEGFIMRDGDDIVAL